VRVLHRWVARLDEGRRARASRPHVERALLTAGRHIQLVALRDR